MRFLSLATGLVGLLGVSLAAPISEDVPSPADIAGVTIGSQAYPPGSVQICDALRGKGTCVEITAHKVCRSLPSPVRYNVHSLIQRKGNLCFYSQGTDCGTSGFGVNSLMSEVNPDVSPKWANAIASVRCYPNPFGANDNTVDTSAPSEPSLQVRAEAMQNLEATTNVATERSTATAASPAGDALLCSGPITTGPCFKVPSSNQCTQIPSPVNKNVRTVRQNKGSFCEYFSDNGCYGRLGSSDSTLADMQFNVPDQIATRMSAARCRLTTMIAAGRSEDAVEAGTDSAEPFEKAAGVEWE